MGRQRQWSKARRTRDGGKVVVIKYGRKKSAGCFPASAKVLTAQALVPIAQLQVGDLIQSVDIKTGKIVTRRLLKKIEKSECPIWCVETSDRSVSIETTIGHAFFTQRGWRHAYALRDGDHLICYQDGISKPVAVKRVMYTGRSEKVFNIVTEVDNNFIVDGVLVHNFAFFRSVRKFWANLDLSAACLSIRDRGQILPLRP